MAGQQLEFNLSDESLEWAKKHLQKFSDGDIFPKPFEFHAIWFDWVKLKDELKAINLYKYQTGATRIMGVPKSSTGFRISHQLDPIDSLIYFSLIYYIVPQLEKYRFPFEEGVSCSYRFKLEDENGNLFDKDLQQEAWKSFENKTKEYTDKFEYILVADIADFYNSIYTHRVHNSICDSFEFFDEKTEETDHVANIIEKFLMSLTASSSKGIPVGPTASIVISEFILTDIDYYLNNNNVKFTRYADDLRIFAETKQEAYKILQELTKYLYMHHKLSLSSSKTYIEESSKFISKILDPELEENKQKQEWHEILGASIFDTYGLNEEEEKEAKKERRKIIESLVFDDMFDYLIKEEKFDLAVARHLFGKIKHIEDNVITLKVVQNLEKLLPAIKNVALFLIEVLNEDFVDTHKDLISEKILELKEYKIPFVDMWLDYMLIKNKNLHKLKLTEKVFLENNGFSCKRKAFLMSLFKKKFSHIREYKELSFSLDPWSLRGLIYASQLLPTAEKAWLDKLDNKNILDKSLTRYVRRRKNDYEQEV